MNWKTEQKVLIWESQLEKCLIFSSIIEKLAFRALQQYVTQSYSIEIIDIVSKVIDLWPL